MIGRAILTPGEFQLMCAIVRTQALPGLKGLALQENAPPQQVDRSGLLSKGLLEIDENGHLEANPTAGYLFSSMADCTAWLRMDIAFDDGTATRKVLYLVDDAFVIVDWKNTNEIEYIYMITIPQVVSTLLTINHNEARNSMPYEDVLMDDPTAPAMLSTFVSGEVEPRAAIHLVTEGTEEGFAGIDTSFVVDANGDSFRLLSNNKMISFKREPVDVLVRAAFERVLSVHRMRVISMLQSEVSPTI